MDYGERTTGTRDEHYNLISVLYHALHGAENCDRYAADAEVAGATSGLPPSSGKCRPCRHRWPNGPRGCSESSSLHPSSGSRQTSSLSDARGRRRRCQGEAHR